MNCNIWQRYGFHIHDLITIASSEFHTELTTKVFFKKNYTTRSVSQVAS